MSDTHICLSCGLVSATLDGVLGVLSGAYNWTAATEAAAWVLTDEAEHRVGTLRNTPASKILHSPLALLPASSALSSAPENASC